MEDTKDLYPKSDEPYEGRFVSLTEEQFQEAVVLRDRIPAKLLLTTETVIGSPDAGDWGGIYLELKIGVSRRFWLIDQKEDNLPDYLIPYKNEINDAIQRINQ